MTSSQGRPNNNDCITGRKKKRSAGSSISKDVQDCSLVQTICATNATKKTNVVSKNRSAGSLISKDEQDCNLAQTTCEIITTKKANIGSKKRSIGSSTPKDVQGCNLVQTTCATTTANETTIDSSTLERMPVSEATADRRWDEMYDQLIQYKNEHKGSIKIGYHPKASPMVYYQQKLLREWCKSQVQQLRRWSQGYSTDENWAPGQMHLNEFNEDKVEKLRQIGFQVPPSYDEMYERLAAHKAETGALDVKRTTDKDLYEWTMEQKNMLNQHFCGEPVSLSDERIRNLKLLGFDHGKINNNGRMGVVDTGLIERKWDDMLESLVKYGEERGSFKFPQDSSLLSKAERSIRGWYVKQRKEYRKIQRGEESSLTARRLQRLMSTPGLDLNPRSEVITWEERMRSLRDFIAEHGHCRPQRNSPLGIFVQNIRTYYRQRQEGKATCLTDERVNDLIALGFEFHLVKPRQKPNAAYVSWEERFEALL